MAIIRLLALCTAMIALAACSALSPSRYFIDTVDNGHDVLNAGCHVEYLSESCSEGEVIGVVGDSCLSPTTINEYTNASICHEHDNETSPADIAAVNCDAVCGSRGGRCEVVENACSAGGITVDSARCVCNR